MELKLYENIKEEIRTVIDCENNAAAWRVAAREAMTAARTLIAAEKKINPDATKLDPAELIKKIRAEVETDNEDAEAVCEAVEGFDFPSEGDDEDPAE